jgi:hypothetical protein
MNNKQCKKQQGGQWTEFFKTKHSFAENELVTYTYNSYVQTPKVR